MLEKPVVVIIYNRPDKVKMLMAQIARAKPRRVFLIADGPKTASVSDKIAVEEAIKAFRENLTWSCEVFENIAPANLGCGKRISSGLDWVFSQVDEAIILEDDCIPNDDFFRFCTEMLDAFKGNREIGVISGSNFLPLGVDPDHDFFVSNYAHIWGWATWKSTWMHYDFGIKNWPNGKSEMFNDVAIRTRREKRYWKLAFDSAKSGALDTWDYQLVHMLWSQNLKTIVPTKNLVSNTGFDKSATNTFFNRNLSERATYRFNWPVRWPGSLSVDSEKDKITSKEIFEISWVTFILRKTFFSLPEQMRRGIRVVVRKLVARGSSAFRVGPNAPIGNRQ